MKIKSKVRGNGYLAIEKKRDIWRVLASGLGGIVDLDKKGLTQLHDFTGKALNIPNKDWKEELRKSDLFLWINFNHYKAIEIIEQIIFGGKK